MNTKKLTYLLSGALILAPALTNAQWSQVRFDQVNSFNLVAAPASNTVFAVGNEWMGNYFVMRSNNGGASWDSIPLNTVNDTYLAMEVFFTDVNTGFIGGFKNNSTQALLKTLDNGTTWTDITPAPASADGITAVYFLNDQQGFASSGTTLYSTTDGGANWSSQNLFFTVNDLNFSDMSNGFAAGYIVGNNAVFAQTSDGGQTWNSVLSVLDPMVFASSFGKIDVISPGVMYTNLQFTNKLYRTLNNGLSWDTIVVDSVMAVHDFDYVSTTHGHVLSSMGQIYAKENSAPWTLEYATAWGFYGPLINLYAIVFTEETGYVVGNSGLIKKHEETTSISDASANAQLHVYPNPSESAQQLLVKTEGISGDGQLQLVNAVGQIVFRQAFNNMETQPLLTLPALQLAPGAYFLSLETQGQRSVQKLMITK